MLRDNKVPVWVTFAVQIHIDLASVLEPDALAAQFAKYQETVKKRSSEFDINAYQMRPFLEPPGNKRQIEPSVPEHE
jgi:hypothetical protein